MSKPLTQTLCVEDIFNSLSHVLRKMEFSLAAESILLRGYGLRMKSGRTEPYKHFQHFCLDTNTQYNDGYSRLMFAYASALKNTGLAKPSYVQAVQFAMKLYLQVTDHLGVCRLIETAPERFEYHNSEKRAKDTESITPISKRQQRKERRILRELFNLNKDEMDACYASPTQHEETELELLDECDGVLRSAPILDPAPTVLDHTVQADPSQSDSSAQIDVPTDGKSNNVNSVSGESDSGNAVLNTDASSGELPPRVYDLSPLENSKESQSEEESEDQLSKVQSDDSVKPKALTLERKQKLDDPQQIFSDFIFENADLSLLRSTFAEKPRQSVIADLKRSVDALSISTTSTTTLSSEKKPGSGRKRKMKLFRAE